MDTQELSNSILSAIEKDKVILFNQDPLMVEAVKKYILAVVYKQGVINAGQEHNSRINWAMNLAWGATDGKGYAPHRQGVGAESPSDDFCRAVD